jgi:hypothetical protein
VIVMSSGVTSRHRLTSTVIEGSFTDSVIRDMQMDLVTVGTSIETDSDYSSMHCSD